MDINQIKSNLKMNNFFFSNCAVQRSEKVINGDYKANIKKYILKTDEHTYDVKLELTIEKEDLNLLVVANAQFIYEAADYEKEESIVNTNTVAIMFPFIRSQVSLLTTQPGMSPIILPPINTARLK